MDQTAPQTFRTIEAAPAGTPAHPSRATAGPAPQLSWLQIELLVVDPAYQREISSVGRKNIRRIVEGFRWTRFSPVIVAPVEGGRFAILDGQHRTTAAALIGIDSVPCQIVFATPGEQAEAFTAINGATTRMHNLALYKAALAAGDAEAMRIADVAARATVKILASPTAELKQKPGETMAIGALKEAIRAYGDDATVLALRCVRETRNNVQGGLLAAIITSMSHFVARALSFGHEPAEILAFFEGVLLIRELDKAKMTERPKGTAVWTVLVARIDAAWVKYLGKGA
jgi:hypothetical protein